MVGDIHTNTVEGFYSVFKRGMKGVYQHCKAKHLHRYVAEFDFRHKNRVKLGVDAAAGRSTHFSVLWASGWHIDSQLTNPIYYAGSASKGTSGLRSCLASTHL